MAPRQPRTRQPEPPVEDPGPPIDQTAQPQVAHPDQPQSAEEDDRGDITTSDMVLQPREVEVDPIGEPPVGGGGGGGGGGIPMMEIRMNTTIEDFTYGNPNMHLRLEEGHRYRVPVYIGTYLDGLGYVWH